MCASGMECIRSGVPELGGAGRQVRQAQAGRVHSCRQGWMPGGRCSLHVDSRHQSIVISLHALQLAAALGLYRLVLLVHPEPS